jgi:hypothetical protein
VRRSLIPTLGSVVLAVACSSADVPQASLSANAADSTITDQPARADAAPSRQTRAPGGRQRSTRAHAPAARAPEYREVVLPTGTALSLRLASPVASDTSQVEDAVQASLREGVTVNGEAVLPAGTEVVGHVTDVERSGRVKGRARIALRFTMLEYDGDEYDVRSEAIERYADATKRKDAAKIGVGAGAGAAVGAMLGGGSGAAKGAAIGAAAGTGTVLATRGEEIRLDAGDSLVTHLTSPLRVRIRIPTSESPAH